MANNKAAATGDIAASIDTHTDGPAGTDSAISAVASSDGPAGTDDAIYAAAFSNTMADNNAPTDMMTECGLCDPSAGNGDEDTTAGKEKENTAAAGNWNADTSANRIDLENYFYLRHKESFYKHAFDSNKAGNSTFKSKAELDNIKYVVQTCEREKNNDLTEEDIQVFRRFKSTNKAGYKWLRQYKTITIDVNGCKKMILHCLEVMKGDTVLSLGWEIIPKEEVFDAINNICSTGHMGMDHTYTYCSPTYYSIIQDMVQCYCKTCHVCIEANPIIAHQKGAKKPIYSDAWHDCFQVDLVDYRKMAHLNVYGELQRWIMTVKDHSTGFTALFSLPRKKPMFVAF